MSKIRNYFKIFVIVTAVLSLFSGCMDFEEKEESVAPAYNSEVIEYINSILPFEVLDTVGLGLKTVYLSQPKQISANPVEVKSPHITSSTAEYYYPFMNEVQTTGLKAVTTHYALHSVSSIWPGNLIQGVSLQDDALAEVPLSEYRKPAMIYLDVVNGQTGMFREITNMSGVTVNQAINDILSKSNLKFPAKLTYSSSVIYSKEELAFGLDIDVENLEKHTGNAFNGVDWGNIDKKWIMVHLNQEFFRVNYQYESVNNLYNSSLTPDSIKDYVYEDNPLCYISSVGYGRYYVLLIEVNAVNQTLNNVLPKIYDREETDEFNNTDENIFNTLVNTGSVWMFMAGGDPKAGLATFTGDPKAIRDYIVNGAEVSYENVGAPINYELHYAGSARVVSIYKQIDNTSKYKTFEKSTDEVDVRVTFDSFSALKASFNSSASNWHPLKVAFNIKIAEVFTIDNSWNSLNRGKFSYHTEEIHVNSGAHYGYPYNSVDIKDLNVDHKVMVHYSVYYNTKRGRRNGTVKDNQTHKYDIYATYKLNRATNKWELYSAPSISNADSTYYTAPNLYGQSSFEFTDGRNYYTYTFNLRNTIKNTKNP